MQTSQQLAAEPGLPSRLGCFFQRPARPETARCNRPPHDLSPPGIGTDPVFGLDVLVENGENV